MKSTTNRAGFLQIIKRLKNFSRTSLSMHILPVVFAMMFVVVIQRSTDEQSAGASETSMAKTEAVSTNAAQVSVEVPEQAGSDNLARIISIAGPANASMVVMFCKTTAVIAKLARI